MMEQYFGVTFIKYTVGSPFLRDLAVVKVWDRGWPCHELEPSTTKDPLNLSRAQTSSRWCGVVVKRGGCQLRCRPRHLTMVQNYVVRRQKPGLMKANVFIRVISPKNLLETNEICVSGDGTWKTRGHTSCIGVCSIIGDITGKVIDVEVLSSYCKGCDRWKSPKYGTAYQEWKKSHEPYCVKNQSGSSGHIQKRMGARLRRLKLVCVNRGKKLSDG
ncbi:uncharacterized protein TNCV_2833001 [Trichonephila clavipes]|nr:uncharacterized protein TNCV_2833001 [Trichonephila clavipes]